MTGFEKKQNVFKFRFIRIWQKLKQLIETKVEIQQETDYKNRDQT